MKCVECTDYLKCSKEHDLRMFRRHCKKAKEEKVVTNADRIRAMTVEELAKFLVSVENRRRGNSCGAVWHLPHVALEWLQQPAEGDA